MKKILVAIATIAVMLAIPALASSTLTEVGAVTLTAGSTGSSGASGATGTTGATGPLPSCPASPCEVISRTTGMQVKVGKTYSPLTIPRNGTIVAWTITLSRPTASQIAYFNAHEGGPAAAAIAIVKHTKGLSYQLAAQSPLIQLPPYFGEKAQFALAATIPVKKGERIGLTVPTWAPALAVKQANATAWRASRPTSGCTSTTEASTQTAQTSAGSVVQYSCLYLTARLMYTATLISTP